MTQVEYVLFKDEYSDMFAFHNRYYCTVCTSTIREICSETKCIHKTKLLDTKASNLSLILISLGYCSFILQQVRYESVISPTNG